MVTRGEGGRRMKAIDEEIKSYILPVAKQMSHRCQTYSVRNK